MNDAPSDIILAARSVLVENSAPSVFIGGIEMIDQDSNTKPSCKLLHSSNGRVRLTGLILLVGSPTDYESLYPSKSLQIVVECSDQYGASVTRNISVPVEGNVWNIY